MEIVSRTKKTTLNLMSNLFLYFIQTILAFIVRVVFIRKLGAELLGLNNLVINIVTMLSAVESGFSTVISYKLYKPLADHNIKRISLYVTFYKKIYKIIGIIVLSIGIIISLFLNRIVDYNYNYLYLVYYLYLFNIVFLYFISYKEVLLIADQQNYKIFKFNCFFTCLLYILQLVSLFLFPNNILYLFVFLLCKIINRVVNNIYITNYYKNIKFNSKNKIKKTELKQIKKSVFNVFCFKVGDYIVNCVDTLLISSLINILYVFIYSSYLSVINILSLLIKKVYDSVAASFANFIVLKDKESELNIFKVMYFFCFLICGYVTICLLNLFNIFIGIWIGSKYILSFVSVIIICLNFYLCVNQYPLDIIKEVRNFYDKDKFVPLILAFFNFVLSLILGKRYGLNGILISTTISYLVTVFWNKPYIIYKNIFKTTVKEYYIDQLKFFGILIIIYFITNIIFYYMNLTVSIFSFVVVGIISTIIYFVIIILLFYKRDEFKCIYNLSLNLFKK